jgi:protocatechuate 3,4-dioxygenase beta subunit
MSPRRARRTCAALLAMLAASLLTIAPARSAPSTESHIHGRLIDGNGKPIDVAQVLLVVIATKTVFAGAASAKDGTFRFWGMQPGQYGIIAQKKMACAVSHVISIKPGKTYDVVVRMPSTGRCYGATHFPP